MTKHAFRSRRAAPIAVALLLASSASAQVQVSFQPSILSLTAGESQLIEARITGIPSPGLAAFQLTATFDESVATLSDPNAGFGGVEPFAPLGNDPQCTTVRGTPTCLDPPWLLTSTGRTPTLGLVDAATPGQTTVVFGTTGGQVAPESDGALLLFRIDAVADGGTVVALSGIPAAATAPPSALPFAASALFVNVGPFSDTDTDGIADTVDNCLLLANADQRDSNGDGYGNRCDPDINNDGVINAVDLGLFKLVFFTPDADADFNGDGIVNVVDLGIMRTFFFMAPGPSAIAP